MAQDQLTHRERLQASLAGEAPDRVPVALWRHFPVDDQTPETLADAVLAFQRQHDFDLVKVTPASSFCTVDWGTRDVWRGSTEGTRDYTRRVIHNPEDWEQLPELQPDQGSLGRQMDCLRKIKAELGSSTPIIQTIFNPLSQARYLAGADTLMIHLRRHPDAVHAGLAIISESTRRFVEACLELGIDGVFFAVRHASYALLSVEEYVTYGRTYDLKVLEAAQPGWLNMLHLHGDEVMFGQFLDYPVQIINWHDRDTAPSLREARALYEGALCGGLQRERTMVLGTPEEVTAEALDAIEATGGRRFILGTGCVLPTISPYGNIQAARRSVEAA